MVCKSNTGSKYFYFVPYPSVRLGPLEYRYSKLILKQRIFYTFRRNPLRGNQSVLLHLMYFRFFGWGAVRHSFSFACDTNTD
jgi:hypothetical protein